MSFLNVTTIYISRTTNFKNNRHPCHRSHRRHGRHCYRHHHRKVGMIVPGTGTIVVVVVLTVTSRAVEKNLCLIKFTGKQVTCDF